MSPENQRIAIAEFLGWRKTKSGRHWVSPTARKSPVRYRIPDFLNDLNAMHAAEKYLSDYRLFIGHLVDIIGEGQYSVHASSAQRAKAFLKAIEKWKDNPK